MSAIIKTLHKLGSRFDRCAEHFAFHHPHLAYVTMFIGMPIFLLAVVSMITILFSMPIALIFGWW